MSGKAGCFIAFGLAAGLSGGAAGAADWPALPQGTELRPLAFSELSGWTRDDVQNSGGALIESCNIILDPAAKQPGLPTPLALKRICDLAIKVNWRSEAKVRTFFEQEFQPFEVIPPSGQGFLTGYYEPEVAGSFQKTDAFTAPLLSRPPDLVSVERGQVPPGLPPELSAAGKAADGSLVPFPDRAAILDGAIADRSVPLVWLKDAVEVFLVQVQGSTRVRLPDGTQRRFAYDGKNGWPYTSIGKKIVEEGHVPLEELTLDRLKSWLRENPEQGERIMRLNRSYVFFRAATELDGKSDPLGGSGAILTPMRSIAIDQSLWPYGLPAWLDVELPLPSGGTERFQHLTIAQDTGSAIVGPARADLYHGTGDYAGQRAGLLRHPMRFIVLLPKAQR